MVIAYEKELLVDALNKFNCHLSKVAEHFGMSRNTLYNRLEYHGINSTEYRKKMRQNVRVVNGGLLIPVGAKRRQFVATVPKIGKAKGSF